MPPGIGYSRDIPLAGDAGGRPGGGATKVGGVSPQQAVKIFSLRVPERVSQGAIAPLPLLTSQGSAGAGAEGLDSLIAALMQAFRPTPAGPPVLQPPPDSFGGWLDRERGINRPQPSQPMPTFGPPNPPRPVNPPPPRVTPGDEFIAPDPIPVQTPHTPTAPVDLSPTPAPSEPRQLFGDDMGWHTLKKDLFSGNY